MGWEERKEYERLLEYPFDFEEYMERRLRDIEDLDERRFAKLILDEGLRNVIRITEEKYKQLERRVFDEIENKGMNFAVYTSVCEREDFDPIHEFLFAMCPPEEIPLSNTKDLKKSLDGLDTPKAMHFYLDADISLINSIKDTDRRFSGEIILEDGSAVPATYIVRQDMRYMAEVERLYRLYRENELPWTTVNCTYLIRFFTAYLASSDESTVPNQPVKGFKIAFEEFAPYIRQDAVALWNIRKFPLKSADFMIPCIDIKAWDHKVSLEETGIQNEYLIEPNDVIIGYRRESENLVITTTVQELPALELFMVAQRCSALPLGYRNLLLSNRKKDSFIKRYTDHSGVRLCTRAELIRKIEELEDSAYLEFQGSEIVQSNFHSNCYNMNPFLAAEWGDPDSRRVLLLKFRQNNNQTWICGDIMSFIISEMQMTFDEYRCEGVFI